MDVFQTTTQGGIPDPSGLIALAAFEPTWVLAFGPEPLLRQAHAALLQAVPGAVLMGCSTAGEISSGGVDDDSLTLSAVRWANVRTLQSTTELRDMDDSLDAGIRLAGGLPRAGLRAVVVLAQGVKMNGTALIEGMTRVLGDQVPLVGGMAGDGGAFQHTVVMDNQGVSDNRLVCAGLYGDG